MKRTASALALSAFVALLSGCSRKPVAVPLETLSFPVVLITGTHASGAIPARVEVVASRQALGRMRVEIFSRIGDETLTDPPIVIDATADAFDMKEINGGHGGLWMMANPTAAMPIRFKLFRRKATGIAAAREIIAKSQYLGQDIDAERTKRRATRILRAKSMAEIMNIIDEVQASQSGPRPHPFEPKN